MGKRRAGSDGAPFVRWFDDLGRGDVAEVGGKNAALGELRRCLAAEGVRVPPGFATTAAAWRALIAHNGLEQPIRRELDALAAGERKLEAVGKAIRKRILKAELPEELGREVRAAYRELAAREGDEQLPVAARSSATAEDLPEASFAGQLESFLELRGEEALLEALRKCFASLYTDRAIRYREHHGFEHLKVALSVGVQRMVRAGEAGAGVLFTLDTETGFRDVVLIDAAWGLGEALVGGSVDPDEYRVFKPLLEREGLRPILERTPGDKRIRVVYTGDPREPTREEQTDDRDRRRFVLADDEVLQLARWGVAIERHWGVPMDVEWAKDAQDGQLYVVQARPETVQSRRAGGTLQTFKLLEQGEVLAEGVAVGSAIASGAAFVLASPDQGARFEDGGVLVAERTNPDWGPLMTRAAAIVTALGGRTSHAAIVSRELGLPAVIGVGDGLARVEEGAEVTVSCAEGERGRVYAGALEFEAREVDPRDLPRTRTQVMINLASPGGALRWWNLPCDGIGLARIEFVIQAHVQVHPLAALAGRELADKKARRRITELAEPYGGDARELYVDRLARGIAKIAAAVFPRPAVVRFSDFKTSEYADLIGGEAFEPREPNPMLGFRGAARYASARFRPAFELECEAMRRAREEIGLTNVIPMVPFCRTPEEADRVLAVLAENGLARGVHGLALYVMAEIPSNVVLVEEFAERFDGFSIGSNDLTQLVLGVDRDNQELAELFDEGHPAIVRTIRDLIARAHAKRKPVGLCGQAPSDRPAFARVLVEAGIDSISVAPDSFVDVRRIVAEAESEADARSDAARAR